MEMRAEGEPQGEGLGALMKVGAVLLLAASVFEMALSIFFCVLVIGLSSEWGRPSSNSPFIFSFVLLALATSQTVLVAQTSKRVLRAPALLTRSRGWWRLAIALLIALTWVAVLLLGGDS